MLSTRLVQMIEDHAEELTRGVISELKVNSKTPHYHHLSREELHDRTYSVYRHLGHWLTLRTDEAIEIAYGELAKKRYAEGIPLSEVVYALGLVKHHLRDYIRSAGAADSAVELYREQELRRLVGHFFDSAIYYTVRGYELEAALCHARVATAHSVSGNGAGHTQC